MTNVNSQSTDALYKNSYNISYLWATSFRTLYLIFLSKHLSFRFSRNLTREAILRDIFERFGLSSTSWNIANADQYKFTKCKIVPFNVSHFKITLWFGPDGTSTVGTPVGISRPPRSKSTACTCIFPISNSLWQS